MLVPKKMPTLVPKRAVSLLLTTRGGIKVKAAASFVTAAARMEIVRAEGSMVLDVINFVEQMATQVCLVACCLDCC